MSRHVTDITLRRLIHARLLTRFEISRMTSRKGGIGAIPASSSFLLDSAENLGRLAAVLYSRSSVA